MNYLEVITITFPAHLPYLVAWLVGIIIAVRMLRRDGGKAEKLLLAGCSLMFTSRIASLLLTGLSLWLVTRDEMTRASVAGLISLPTSILSMAGIVCLILAFWMRWKTKSAAQ